MRSNVDAADDNAAGHDRPAASFRGLGAREVVSLLRETGRKPRKYLGQHFLADPGLAAKIVRLAEVERGDCVIELGPGVGSLTVALEAAGAAVIAIEKDPALARVAAQTAPNAVVVCADALEADPLKLASTASTSETAELEGEIQQACGTELSEARLRAKVWVVRCFELSDRWKLVSNLPYSVGTSLLLRFVCDYPRIASGVVMLQREVAERLVAPTRSRRTSAPTLIFANFVEARIVGTVPPDVFVPRPRVESALLAFRRRDAPLVDSPFPLLRRLVEESFGHRRKKLQNALAGLKWFSDPRSAATIFEVSGVDPSSRPEEIGLEGFAALADAVEKLDPSWEKQLASERVGSRGGSASRFGKEV